MANFGLTRVRHCRPLSTTFLAPISVLGCIFQAQGSRRAVHLVFSCFFISCLNLSFIASRAHFDGDVFKTSLGPVNSFSLSVKYVDFPILVPTIYERDINSICLTSHSIALKVPARFQKCLPDFRGRIELTEFLLGESEPEREP